jgi:hypothetical protein
MYVAVMVYNWCVMYVAAPHRLVANVGCTPLISVECLGVEGQRLVTICHIYQQCLLLFFTGYGVSEDKI